MLGLEILTAPVILSQITSNWLLPYYPPEPWNQVYRNPNLSATDSVCSTWFGRISMNGELKGNKPDSPCQPKYDLSRVTKAG
jgi:hypothetical protein